MITNLQIYFQKHYRWMFTVLLVIMIVPFIFSYGPGSRMGSARRNFFSKADTFFGYDLSDKAQKEELTRLAEVGEWIKTGATPYDMTYANELAWKRVIELAMADRIGVPTPTADQLTSYMGSLPVFQGKDGSFSQKKFSDFQEQFLRCGFSKDALTDAVIERWRLDQLSDAMNGAAFFLPTTVEREYALTNAKYSIKAFTIKPAFDAGLAVSEDEAKQFFSKNKSRYDTPELREGVIYSLPCEGFVSRVSVPSEAELQKFFDQNSFRFIQWQMKDDKGHSSGKEPKAPVLSEHRDETIKLYKQAKAARMAADMVDTLVGKLYADKIAPDSAAWSQMLNAAGLKKTSIKTEDALADETSLQALSALSLNGRSFSGALQTESDGRFILLTKVTPAHSQEYSAVSQRVKADALDAKRQSEDFKILTAKVDSLKKSFKSGQLDAEASKAGFEVINPDHFTVNEPAKIVSSSELLQSLVKAKVGDILSAVDSTKAVVIALQERRIPPFNPQGAKAQEVRKQLGAFYKELSELSYLNEYARVYAK